MFELACENRLAAGKWELARRFKRDVVMSHSAVKLRRWLPRCAKKEAAHYPQFSWLQRVTGHAPQAEVGPTHIPAIVRACCHHCPGPGQR